MKLTQAQLEAKAKTRWQIATVAFADGDGTDGWTQLLAMGMDLAAITGEPLKNDELTQIARAGGLLP